MRRGATAFRPCRRAFGLKPHGLKAVAPAPVSYASRRFAHGHTAGATDKPSRLVSVLGREITSLNKRRGVKLVRGARDALTTRRISQPRRSTPVVSQSRSALML